VDTIFAGWRMAYIKSARKTGGCLFCRLTKPGDDAGRLVLARRRYAYLMLNAFPYNSGHLMVVAARHAATLGELSGVERRDLWDLAARGESLLAEVYHPDGLNVGANLGRSAGAGIDGHLHLHLVPRWKGDTNFMVTVGNTKVLPEDLEETYRRLSRALSGARGGSRPIARPRRRLARTRK